MHSEGIEEQLASEQFASFPFLQSSNRAILGAAKLSSSSWASRSYTGFYEYINAMSDKAGDALFDGYHLGVLIG